MPDNESESKTRTSHASYKKKRISSFFTNVEQKKNAKYKSAHAFDQLLITLLIN